MWLLSRLQHMLFGTSSFIFTIQHAVVNFLVLSTTWALCIKRKKGTNRVKIIKSAMSFFPIKKTAAADAKLKIKGYHHHKNYFFFLIPLVLVLQLNFVVSLSVQFYCCFLSSISSCCPTSTLSLLLPLIVACQHFILQSHRLIVSSFLVVLVIIVAVFFASIIVVFIDTLHHCLSLLASTRSWFHLENKNVLAHQLFRYYSLRVCFRFTIADTPGIEIYAKNVYTIS
jgi:hypothetical protein